MARNTRKRSYLKKKSYLRKRRGSTRKRSKRVQTLRKKKSRKMRGGNRINDAIKYAVLKVKEHAKNTENTVNNASTVISEVNDKFPLSDEMISYPAIDNMATAVKEMAKMMERIKDVNIELQKVEVEAAEEAAVVAKNMAMMVMKTVEPVREKVEQVKAAVKKVEQVKAAVKEVDIVLTKIGNAEMWATSLVNKANIAVEVANLNNTIKINPIKYEMSETRYITLVHINTILSFIILIENDPKNTVSELTTLIKIPNKNKYPLSDSEIETIVLDKWNALDKASLEEKPIPPELLSIVQMRINKHFNIVSIA